MILFFLKKILGFLGTLLVFCWIGSLVFEEVYGEVSRDGGCLGASIHIHCVMTSVYTYHDDLHVSW